MNEINAILSRDPGGRGLMAFADNGDTAALMGELSRMERALIITGFPVTAEDSRVCCETDGPVGAADMAYALTKLGIAVDVVTDRTSFEQVRAAVELRAPGATLWLYEGGAANAMRLVEQTRPTHVISIERPGKAADGHCHTARGAVLDGMLADTDELYALCREAGAVAVAIGDGGNELGTGRYRDAVKARVPGGGEIAAALDADITLISGVSNWWGWGVAALASAIAGADLLPADEDETRLMRELIASGAVDGITKKPVMSVDNLSVEENLAVLGALRETVKKYLSRRA